MIDTLRTLSMLILFAASAVGTYIYLDHQPAWMIIATGGGGLMAAYLFWMVADLAEPLPHEIIEEEWL